MAESETHILLVRLLYSWIGKEFLNNDCGAICADLPEFSTFSKPPLVFNQYRPDIFIQKQGLMIIGEAKTEKDLECSHSKKQFESYIRTCELHEGTTYVIVSVPCFVESSARNMLRQICRKIGACKTQILVISKLMQ